MLKKSSDALAGAEELDHLGSTSSPAGEKGCGQPRKGFIERKAPYVNNAQNSIHFGKQILSLPPPALLSLSPLSLLLRLYSLKLDKLMSILL